MNHYFAAIWCLGLLVFVYSKALSGGRMSCDDCEQPTEWKHAVQTDPWGRPTGEVYCENCAERHWYRQQEKLMEET